MTYDDLFQLFLEGAFEEVISKGEIYTLNHPEDTDAIFLQAISHYNFASQSDDVDKLFWIVEYEVLPLFHRMLSLEPDNDRFIYYYLYYSLEVDGTTQSTQIKGHHVTLENKNNYINLAEKLCAIKGYEMSGLDFLVKIQEVVGSLEDQLLVVKNALNFNNNLFEKDRETRDINFALYWPKKVIILDQLNSISKSDLLLLIEENIWRFDSENNTSFIDLAEIAKRENHWDLVVKLLFKMVNGENYQEHEFERIKRFYTEIKSQYIEGWKTPLVINFLLTIERFMMMELEFDENQYFKTAEEISIEFPQDPSVLLYLGTYYYEQLEYSKALEKFEALLPQQSEVRAWRRYVECVYKQKEFWEGDLPTIALGSSDHPITLYNQGVLYDEFASSLPEKHRKQFKKYSAEIYQKSWNAFFDYFTDNQYDTSFYPVAHIRAMCGNNLAIIINEYFDENEKALMIVLESKAYSQFPELDATAIKIYKKLNQHEKIIETAENYFKSDYFDINSFYTIGFDAEKIVAKHQLGEEFTVEELTRKLFEYYNFADYPNLLFDNEVIIMDNACNAIESLLFELFENDTLENKKIYHNDIISKFPLQPNSYYQLAQLANEEEDFETCEWAANQYLITKRKEAYAESNLEKIHFLLLKSKTRQDHYEDAIDYFETHKDEIYSLMDAENWVYTVSVILPAYVNTERYQKVFVMVDDILQVYLSNNVEDHYSYENIMISKAIALHNTGKVKEALVIVNELMLHDDYDPILEEYKTNWKPKGFFSKFF